MIAEPTTAQNVARLNPQRIRWQGSPWELKVLPRFAVRVAETGEVDEVSHVKQTERGYVLFLLNGNSYGVDAEYLCELFGAEWKGLVI